MLKRAKYLNFSEKNQIMTQISQIKSAFLARKFKYSDLIGKKVILTPVCIANFYVFFELSCQRC